MVNIKKINSKFIKKYIVQVKESIVNFVISKAFAAQDYCQFLGLRCVCMRVCACYNNNCNKNIKEIQG